MRIILISPEILPIPPIKGGAVEALIFEIIKRLPEEYKVVCCSIFDSAFPKNEIRRNVTYCRFKPGLFSKFLTISYKFPFKNSNSFLYWLPYSLWCVFKIVKYRPQIIYVHNRIQFIPILRFFFPHTKIMLHVHQLSVLNHEKLWNGKSAKSLSLVIGCSQFIRNQIIKRYPHFSKPQVTYLYNGYDVQRFFPYVQRLTERKAIRERYGINDGERVILYVGRIAHNKGPHVLIEAFSKLIDRHKNIKLMIVGGILTEGQEQKRYFNNLREHNFSPNVIFTGKIDYSEIDKYYLAADIIVVPSLVEEGLGNVVIEAMASGIPVIASNKGGLGELVKHKERGLLVNEIECSDNLVNAIDSLLQSQELMNKFSKNGISFVEENLSWNMIVDRFLSLLSDLSSQKNILFYESSSGLGGSANALALILNNLNCLRYFPIVCIKNYGSQIDKIKDFRIYKLKNYKESQDASSVRVISSVVGNVIPEVFRLYYLIKKNRITLVHVNNNLIAGMPPIIAARLARIPCVCHIRQTRDLIRRERLLIPKISKFIILNENAMRIYGAYVDKSKLKMIPDGIDFQNMTIGDEGAAALSGENYQSNGDALVGIVGRIVEGKGQMEFAEAAQKVLMQGEKVKFLIIGSPAGEDDAYYNRLRQYLESNRLQKDIILTGWLEHPFTIICKLSILVQSSTTYPEGLPNAMLEAMALSKPIIASSIAGQSDIVEDAKTGFLVAPGDTTALAERISYLLHSPNIAETMGAEGRKRVEKIFNIKNTVASLEALYSDLIVEYEDN